jgi:hypothetical protein
MSAKIFMFPLSSNLWVQAGTACADTRYTIKRLGSDSEGQQFIYPVNHVNPVYFLFASHWLITTSQ